MVAGHSLGEFTALVCAGALDFAATVKLVRERGRLMQAAVPEGGGAMAAILGLDEVAAEAACADGAQGEVVEAVNYNAPGQIVIAGQTRAVERDADRGGQGARRQAPPCCRSVCRRTLRCCSAPRLSFRSGWPKSPSAHPASVT